MKTLSLSVAFILWGMVTSSSQTATVDEVQFGKIPEKEWTKKSRTAERLRVGMELDDVLDLLGKPDFATTVGDDREWYSFANNGYELFYSNGHCSPISVSIMSGKGLVGWDEGKLGCASPGNLYPTELLPPQEYSCKRRPLEPCD